MSGGLGLTCELGRFTVGDGGNRGVRLPNSLLVDPTSANGCGSLNAEAPSRDMDRAFLRVPYMQQRSQQHLG